MDWDLNRIQQSNELIHAMIKNDNDYINWLTSTNRDFSSKMMVEKNNPIEILKLFVKYEINIDYSMYPYLVEKNDIETVKFAIKEIKGFCPLAVPELNPKSDEMMLLLLEHGIFFSITYRIASNCSNFINSVRFIVKNYYLSHFEIALLFDNCNIDLLKQIGLDLSLIYALSPGYRESFLVLERIKKYGKFEKFNIVEHCNALQFGPSDWLLLLKDDYISFSKIVNLAECSNIQSMTIRKFSITNTIRLPKIEKKYGTPNHFKIVLPNIISEHLLIELSRIIVDYL